MKRAVSRFSIVSVIGLYGLALVSCNLYYSQTDPYADSPPVKSLSIAPPRYNQIFYDTAHIKFDDPVWFGEYSGESGAFITGELGGDIFLLEPSTEGFQKTLFGHVPAAKIVANDGLLGLAFHPNFKNNRKYYVYYNPALGQGVLEERMADSSFKKDAGFSRIIMQNNFDGFVHNGGDIHFGNDGYLYLSMGDWKNPGAHDTGSQNLGILNGKMIRIDIDHKANGHEYAIPADNPFSKKTDTLTRKEIYAYGFRNPWRWNFDLLNGKIYLGDVGNAVQEEIDTVVKGGNYGWPRMEGNSCYNDSNQFSPLKSCNSKGFIAPMAVIDHDPIQANRAVIGGVVFRGNPASPYYGAYIYADCSTGKIYSSIPPGAKSTVISFGPSGECVDSFGMDFRGNIYVVGFFTGIIYRLNHPDLIGKIQ